MNDAILKINNEMFQVLSERCAKKNAHPIEKGDSFQKASNYCEVNRCNVILYMNSFLPIRLEEGASRAV